MSETPNLKGLRVLNTRARHQAGPLSNAIQNAGGISLELPLLNITPSTEIWEKKLPPHEQIQKAIFVSPNAVNFFFAQVDQTTWSDTIQTFTLGQGTAQALKQHNITPKPGLNQTTSEQLLRHDALQNIQQQNCLLIKGNNGRPLLESTLTARGAQVLSLEVYQRSKPSYDQATLQAIWQEDAVDIILITSETALQNLFALFGENAQDWLYHKPCLVISERLYQAAQKQGIKTIIVSPYKKIIEALSALI